MKDLNWDSDIVINNGDFVLAESDQQHQADIIQAFKGNYKEFPLVGVGIDLYNHATVDESELGSVIKKQLEADGYVVNSITIDTATFKIYVDAIPS
jgi:hypothetical protein